MNIQEIRNLLEMPESNPQEKRVKKDAFQIHLEKAKYQLDGCKLSIGQRCIESRLFFLSQDEQVLVKRESVNRTMYSDNLLSIIRMCKIHNIWPGSYFKGKYVKNIYEVYEFMIQYLELLEAHENKEQLIELLLSQQKANLEIVKQILNIEN